jgi:transposase-like protein
MTQIDRLRATGFALFGDQWQSPLARELGVADRTVRRWIHSDTAIPADVWPRLAAIADRRLELLQAARAAL